MDDLVDRLRRSAKNMANQITSGVGSEPSHYLTGKAADEIERLQFEYERADESAKRLGAKWKTSEAEIEQLRAALQRARRIVCAQSTAEHMMDGLGPRKVRPTDELLAHMDGLLNRSHSRK